MRLSMTVVRITGCCELPGGRVYCKPDRGQIGLPRIPPARQRKGVKESDSQAAPLKKRKDARSTRWKEPTPSSSQPVLAPGKKLGGADWSLVPQRYHRIHTSCTSRGYVTR